MSKSTDLLDSAATDFAALRGAYARAGLFNDAATAARTEACRALLGAGDDAYRFRRLFLLADALVRNRVGRAVYAGAGPQDARAGPRARHVSVFGGNNAGKSTVVNILAAVKAADASHLGGFTRHAQAFLPPGMDPAALLGGNPHTFTGFRQVSAGDLRPEVLGQYGVARLPSSAMPADVVLWDTPDCDSVDSRQYLGAVVEAVSLADVVIYVTSKATYVSAYLIEWVFLLHHAGVNIVECLNQTPRKEQASIIANEREKHYPSAAAQFGEPIPDPPVVGLYYMVEGEEEDLYGEKHPPAAALRQAVVDALATATTGDGARRASQKALGFVTSQLQRLLGPVRAEIEATRQWDAAVNEGLRIFVEAYERLFLKSDRKEVSEPFRELDLQILQLLDPNIPGLKQALQLTRWVTRLPSQLVIFVGKKIWKKVFGEQGAHGSKLPPEVKAYVDAHTELLRRLGNLIETECRSQPHHPFWDDLGRRWEAELPAVNEEFSQQVERHMRQTQERIGQAARDIYNELNKAPAVVNALKTVKVSLDAGAIAVGFFLPGHGAILADVLQDAVFDYAMLTGVNAATQAAVQQFVQTRRRQLEKELVEDARGITQTVYSQRLRRIRDEAMRENSLGVGPDLVERLPKTLAALKEAL